MSDKNDAEPMPESDKPVANEPEPQEEAKVAEERADDNDDVVSSKDSDLAVPSKDSDLVVSSKSQDDNDVVISPRIDAQEAAEPLAKPESPKESAHNLESKKSPPASSPARNKNYVYNVKWIRFNKQEVPIVMQNENGPCPLLSICNVLLLRQQLELSRKIESITGDDIVNKIADTLFNDFLPKWRDSDQRRERLNLEKNVDDALEILQGLERGLDVNVRFNRADSFEYTKEMVVFDIFSINLYHGWVVDPQEVELNSVVGDLSYNQLVDKVITLKNKKDPDSNEAFLIDHFLECTASQLTYHGLAELHSLIKPNELCIFFRNNHFSTIYKSANGRLFTLVTDAGFLNRSEVVWESLTNIEGDEVFLDSKFVIYNEEQQLDDETRNVPPEQAHSEDYLLALALQRDQNDEQLAQIMQAEEEKKARAASGQSSRPSARKPDNSQEQPRSSSQKKESKKGDSTCVIS